GAYRMYSRIRRTLDLGPGASDVAGNVCFEYPNVTTLASYLFALRTGGSYSKRSETEEMQALIDQYGVFTTQKVKDAGPPRVVLLTGVTGSLGAHVLDALVQLPGIEKIYCLNRGSNAHARTIESLKTRGLEVPLDRVESFTADLARPDLGLDPEALQRVDVVIQS